MSASLQKIQALIDSGDKKQARSRLKNILKDNPSADGWYLAALTMESDDDTIKCLRRALKLDALHTPANRLLYQLEKTPSITPADSKSVTDQSNIQMNRQKKLDSKRKQKSNRRRRVGCGCLVSWLFSASIALVTLTTIGVLPGVISTVMSLISDVNPVYQIDNVPIEMVDDSIYQLTPVVSKTLTDQDIFFIDHGYVNQYHFDVEADQSYVIFLQFLSLDAHNLHHNMAINDSEGYNIIPNCERQKISDYDNGVAYVCRAHVTEQWSIRILGIQGESIGGYIVGTKVI